jgi:hypothetical protein
MLQQTNNSLPRNDSSTSLLQLLQRSQTNSSSTSMSMNTNLGPHNTVGSETLGGELQPISTNSPRKRPQPLLANPSNEHLLLYLILLDATSGNLVPRSTPLKALLVTEDTVFGLKGSEQQATTTSS